MRWTLPGKRCLEKHVLNKYGEKSVMGWSPKRRFEYGYFLAGDIYECFIDKLINKNTRWVDVGGGSSILPHNPDLSKELASRCYSLTSVDPSENVFENPYAHHKVRSLFEEMNVTEKYNLATFRMVAEHVEYPSDVLAKLDKCLDKDGLVVIYTINKYCPIPIVTRLTPFSWHHKIKKIFWGGKEKDTFPVAYRMNSKKELDELFFKDNKYTRVLFEYLDDVSATIEFDTLNRIEMIFWKFCKMIGIRYFENNILAVYKKV
ncbi:MAG: methyltransferase domain-containing protein [Marinobacter sp.]|nr:methyltransferase domain-containing protein [Marinobacter sp.]